MDSKDSKPDVKILIGYHIPYKLIKSDVYIPVHAGRDVAFEPSNVKTLNKKDVDWLMKNTTGDNTGDNISYLNRKLCEFTVIYYAWKNQDKLHYPDYIGYMHYRRHFIFSEKPPKNGKRWWHDKSDFYIFNSFNGKYKKMLDEKYLYKLLEKYDVISTKKQNFRKWDTKAATPIEHLTGILGSCVNSPFKMTEQLIYDKYPKYIEVLEEYKKDCSFYPCSMFVFKKEIFNQYCEFIFPILFEITKKCNSEKDSPSKTDRIPAFIGEILTSLFISQYKKEQPSRVKEVDCAILIQKASLLQRIKTLYKLIKIWLLTEI